jgi:hypothetical protein
MRPALTQLERIEQYLSGTMDSSEAAMFENEMATNSELKDLVEQQENLVRAAKRKALRAQIESVAAAGGGGGSSMSGGSWIALSGALVVGLGVGAYVLWGPSGEDDEVLQEDPIAMVQEMVQEADELDSTKSKMEITLDIEDDRIMEEPETIFSSVAHYELETAEDEDDPSNQHPNQTEGKDEKDPAQTDVNARFIKDRSQDRNEIIIDSAPEYQDKSGRANFPGGNVAMKKFMDKHLRYPKSAYDKGIEAVVRCDFQITGDGIIQNINADLVKMSEENGLPFSDMRELFNKKLADAFIGNATHVLRIMPIWEPATNSAGTPIISTQRMYFSYDLKRGCLAYQLSEEFTQGFGDLEETD